MDIFKAIGEQIVTLICSLGQAVFTFPARLAMIWLVGMVACGYTFENGSRSIALQWSVFADVVVIGMVAPIEWIHTSLTGSRVERLLKPAVFLSAVAVNIAVPAMLPSLLTPKYECQRKLVQCFYGFPTFRKNLWTCRASEAFSPFGCSLDPKLLRWTVPLGGTWRETVLLTQVFERFCAYSIQASSSHF